MQTYLHAYLETTVMKKRSILTYCKQINFDFTQFVDAGFKSFMTNYLPLAHMLDFMMIFLSEGRKGQYRVMYSILKCNKKEILKINPKAI